MSVLTATEGQRVIGRMVPSGEPWTVADELSRRFVKEQAANRYRRAIEAAASVAYYMNRDWDITVLDRLRTELDKSLEDGRIYGASPCVEYFTFSGGEADAA